MTYPPTGDPYEVPPAAAGPGQQPQDGTNWLPGPYDHNYGGLVGSPPPGHWPIEHQPGTGYPPTGFYQQGGPYPYPSPYGPRPVNGLAIASLVVSIVGMLGVCAYGLGGYLGIVGLTLGIVGRRQIREQGTDGDGLALAGVIIGGVATGIAVAASAVIAAIIVSYA
jgi:hypothetical protein